MHNYSQNSAKCYIVKNTKLAFGKNLQFSFQAKACILPRIKSAMTGSKLHWVGELKKNLPVHDRKGNQPPEFQNVNCTHQ